MASHFFKTLVICMTIAASSFSSQTAHAGVGLYVSKTNVKVLGGFTTAMGINGVSYSLEMINISNALSVTSAAAYAPGLALGAGVVVVGLVVLENESAQMKFTALSSDDAKKLQISKKERLAFNVDVEMLNAIQDDIVGDISNQKDNNLTIAQTAKMWQDRLGPISQDAQKVAAIISTNFLQGLK